MQTTLRFLLVSGIPVAGFATLLYAAFVRKPANHPRAFLKTGRQPTTKTAVVNAGDSLTHASLSADYVAMLRDRLSESGFEFVNAGVNGDTSSSLLQRIDGIVACRPDAVTIQIGTNDAREIFAKGGAPEEFHTNLGTILARLTSETDASIAVLSVPPLGENLGSDINRIVNQLNSVLQEIATRRGAAYLPLHERLATLIAQDGRSNHIPYKLRFGLLLSNAVRRYMLRQGWDQIAARNGFFVLIDSIHLSDLAAATVADLIATWLSQSARWAYGANRSDYSSAKKNRKYT